MFTACPIGINRSGAERTEGHGNKVPLKSRRRELGKEFQGQAVRVPRYVPRFPGCVEDFQTDILTDGLEHPDLDSRSASRSQRAAWNKRAGAQPSVEFESSSQRPSLDPLCREQSASRWHRIRKTDQFSVHQQIPGKKPGSFTMKT